MRYRRVRIEGAAYFFTLVTHQRASTFAQPEMVALYQDSVRAVRHRHPFETVAEVILPDHLHAVWQLPEGDSDYSMRWRLIKSNFTRAYVNIRAAPEISPARRARCEQGVWQRRFWEHVIESETDFWRHIDYIHLNPVHHGYVSAPKDWPHSTFMAWVGRDVYPTDWGSQEAPTLPDWALRHE